MLPCIRITEYENIFCKLLNIRKNSWLCIVLIMLLLTAVNFDFQLNCENRKLKYLSMSSRPCLDELLPSISDCIALEADAEIDGADSSPDTFTQYQQQVKGKM